MEYIIAVILSILGTGVDAPKFEFPLFTRERPLTIVINYTEPKFRDDENWHIFSGYEDQDYSAIAWLECCSQNVISVSTPGYDFESYGEAFFDDLLVNYAPYKTVDYCEAETLRLFEHDAINNMGIDYISKFWIDSADRDQVIRVHFVFPKDQEALIDIYADLFFPELPDCDENNKLKKK